MATITYEVDVAPHLQRGLMYRRLREQRWQALHKHNYERYNDPYSDDGYDPYSWAKTATIFDLLIYGVVVLFFAAGDEILSLFKSDGN